MQMEMQPSEELLANANPSVNTKMELDRSSSDRAIHRSNGQVLSWQRSSCITISTRQTHTHTHTCALILNKYIYIVGMGMEKNLIKFLLQQNGNNARKAAAKNGIRAHQQQLQFVVVHLLSSGTPAWSSAMTSNLQLVWVWGCVCVYDTRQTWSQLSSLRSQDKSEGSLDLLTARRNSETAPRLGTAALRP